MSYQQEVFNLISSFTGHNTNYVTPKEFMRFLKDGNAALILSQLVYWTGKQADPDGWIYKSYDDWGEEIFLSKKMVMSAVKKLKGLGIVETQVRMIRLGNGMLGNRCVHYRLDQEKLAELILNQLKSLQSADRELSKIPEGNFPKPPMGTFLPINTKTTSKDYDDVPPADPVPEIKKPSSSFSQHDLNDLMQAVPQERKSPQIEQRLTKALIASFTVAYLLDCIAYSHDKDPENFLSYLGNCIDKDYAPEGYHKDKEEIRKKQTKAKAKKEKERLKAIQKQQAIQKKQMEIKRKHEILDKLLKDEPLRYFELVQQAGENLGIDPNKPGRGGKMNIKFEIMRILEL